MEQNLYRNFMAHLASLEKLSVIGSDTLLRLFNYSLLIKVTVPSTFNVERVLILIELELYC